MILLRMICNRSILGVSLIFQVTGDVCMLLQPV